MTLEQAISLHHPQLQALSTLWLQSGARALGISENARILACWGESLLQGEPSTRVPLGQGELWIVGAVDEQTTSRLEWDATTLSHLFRLEDELETMTGELVDAQDQLLALYDLNRSLRRHLNLDELLSAIAQVALELLKCNGAACVFLDGDGKKRIFDASAIKLPETTVGQLFDIVSSSKKPLLYSARDSEGLIPPDMENVMCIPVTLQGQIQAMIGWMGKQGGSFTSPDMKLGVAIADHVSAEIENVLLYNEMLAQARLKRELELAHDIQERLVPSAIPAVRGLEIYARMKPALEVGGDFYDWMDEPDRLFTFTLGDVSGKGMAAALVMAMLRTSLRTTMRRVPQPTCAEILDRVTRDLYDDLDELGMFATICIGAYDVAAGELRLANMGHAPVIYVPAAGCAQLLEADSPPLGVLDFSMASVRVLPFAPGDVLVVATDGFTEARDEADTLYGNETFMDLVAERRHDSAREIADSLYSAVEAFSKRNAEDDQTLIVLRRVS